MDNLIFMDSHCRLPQELSGLLSKWFQNQRCVLGLPWWGRTISSSVWHYNWRRRLDHLSEAHGWLCWLLCRLGIIQKRLRKSGGRGLAREWLPSPSHCITASANMLFRTDMEDYEGDWSKSKPIKYVISISLSIALRILGYLSGKFRNFFHLGSSIELA